MVSRRGRGSPAARQRCACAARARRRRRRRRRGPRRHRARRRRWPRARARSRRRAAPAHQAARQPRYLLAHARVLQQQRRHARAPLALEQLQLLALHARLRGGDAAARADTRGEPRAVETRHHSHIHFHCTDAGISTARTRMRSSALEPSLSKSMDCWKKCTKTLVLLRRHSGRTRGAESPRAQDQRRENGALFYNSCTDH